MSGFLFLPAVPPGKFKFNIFLYPMQYHHCILHIYIYSGYKSTSDELVNGVCHIGKLTGSCSGQQGLIPAKGPHHVKVKSCGQFGERVTMVMKSMGPGRWPSYCL